MISPLHSSKHDKAMNRWKLTLALAICKIPQSKTPPKSTQWGIEWLAKLLIIVQRSYRTLPNWERRQTFAQLIWNKEKENLISFPFLVDWWAQSYIMLQTVNQALFVNGFLFQIE